MNEPEVVAHPLHQRARDCDAALECIAGRFASKLPAERKFDAVDYHTEHGAPVLTGALAWLVCELRELRPGGDHEIAIGLFFRDPEGRLLEAITYASGDDPRKPSAT